MDGVTAAPAPALARANEAASVSDTWRDVKKTVDGLQASAARHAAASKLLFYLQRARVGSDGGLFVLAHGWADAALGERVRAGDDAETDCAAVAAKFVFSPWVLRAQGLPVRDADGDTVLDAAKDPYFAAALSGPVTVAGDSVFVAYEDHPLLFDELHCYVVARAVLHMLVVHGLAGRAGAGTPSEEAACMEGWRGWQWWGKEAAAREPLKLVAHSDGLPGDSRYVRRTRTLEFGCAPCRDAEAEPGARRPWLCRSVRVVCHEVGHAFLDSVAPKLYKAAYGEAAATHEAFADFSYVAFVCMERGSAVDMLACCSNDLRRCAELQAVCGPSPGHTLRDVKNPHLNVLELAHVLCSFYCDVLSYAYASNFDPDRPTALRAAARAVLVLVVQAMGCVPHATFSAVAEAMAAAAMAPLGEAIQDLARQRSFAQAGGQEEEGGEEEEAGQSDDDPSPQVDRQSVGTPNRMGFSANGDRYYGPG